MLFINISSLKNRHYLTIMFKFKQKNYKRSTHSVISTSPLPIMIPIIKIVGNYCNLRCKYCFYHHKDQNERTIMNSELLEKFIKEYLFLFKGKLRFIWHGGEPLLAGISFFKQIVKFQKKYKTKGQEIHNSVQTNGTLINENWAKFFKKYNFGVGVSLDGDKKSHNNFRINTVGRGSFDLTLKGIKILQKYKIRIGILQTLTHYNTSNEFRSKKNFNFFVNNLNVKSIGFPIYRPTKKKERTMHRQAVTNKNLNKYLREIIDLWLKKDDPNLRIREIDCVLAGLLEKQSTLCSYNRTCTAFFCLNYDGKIYPCDRLSHCKKFILGSLAQQSLLKILNGFKRLNFAKKANYLHPDCIKCKWKNACGNGCFDYRKNGKYYFCSSRKKIFHYLEKTKNIQFNYKTKS